MIIDSYSGDGCSNKVRETSNIKLTALIMMKIIALSDLFICLDNIIIITVIIMIYENNK